MSKKDKKKAQEVKEVEQELEQENQENEESKKVAELEERLEIALNFSKKTKEIFESYLIEKIRNENTLNIALEFDFDLINSLII